MTERGYRVLVGFYAAMAVLGAVLLAIKIPDVLPALEVDCAADTEPVRVSPGRVVLRHCAIDVAGAGRDGRDRFIVPLEGPFLNPVSVHPDGDELFRHWALAHAFTSEADQATWARYLERHAEELDLPAGSFRGVARGDGEGVVVDIERSTLRLLPLALLLLFTGLMLVALTVRAQRRWRERRVAWERRQGIVVSDDAVPSSF